MTAEHGKYLSWIIGRSRSLFYLKLKIIKPKNWQEFYIGCYSLRIVGFLPPVWQAGSQLQQDQTTRLLPRPGWVWALTWDRTRASRYVHNSDQVMNHCLRFDWMQSKETLRGSAKYYNCVTSVQINWRKFKDNKLELYVRGKLWAARHYLGTRRECSLVFNWKILQFVV